MLSRVAEMRPFFFLLIISASYYCHFNPRKQESIFKSLSAPNATHRVLARRDVNVLRYASLGEFQPYQRPKRWFPYNR